MKRIFFIVVVFLLVGCANFNRTKTIDPKTVDFQAVYNPDFDGVIYPSMLLALANCNDDDSETLFSVSVTSPSNNAVLRIVADSSLLNYISITQETLPKKGQTYTFTPVIKWKYQSLYRLRQPGNTDLTFTCYINDEEVDVKNIRLNYRSVNECLMSIVGADGTYHDYRWLFSAFVNEEHPKIDNMLSEILGQGLVTIFDGPRSQQKTENQMRAIWFYALNRGIAYSSITCTSNTSSKSNSQFIRFFDDVYNNRQANCIDACVFFSSIMRRVGLQPIIFVDPCHAYLGYYTDKSKKNIALLETTITGWVNLPLLDEHFDSVSNTLDSLSYNKISKYLTESQIAEYKEGKMSLDKIKKAVSNNLFDRASDYQKENYKTNKVLYTDTTNLSYQMLVIDELRKKISPIPAVE